MTPLRQRMLEDMGIRNLADNTQYHTLSLHDALPICLKGTKSSS